MSKWRVNFYPEVNHAAHFAVSRHFQPEEGPSVGAFSVIVKTDGSFAALVRRVTVVRIVSRMDSSKSVKYPKCD